MSLILVTEVKGGGSYLLAADSLVTSGSLRVSDKPKLFQRGEWSIGSTGSEADEHAFFYGLPLDADLSDPALAMDRIRFLKGLRGESSIELGMIAVNGDRCFIINQDGLVWSPGSFDSVGNGDALANSVLRRSHQKSMSVPQALRLCYDIIKAVSEINVWVALPMVYIWDREVKTYVPEPEAP